MLDLQEMWKSPGVGEHQRYILVYTVISDMGPGYRTHITGKRNRFEVWKTYANVTTAVCSLSIMPERISEEDALSMKRLSE